MRYSMLLLSLCCAPLSTAALSAQSSGPLVGLPHGFSVDPGTVLPGAGAAKVLFSNTGFDAFQPPPPPPGFVVPDFAALFAGIPIDIDALSLGFDWVVSTPAGVASVGPNQWAAITASVTPATAGLPGSLVAAENLAPDKAAADTIAYVIPGSALPAGIVGIPFRAQDGAELDPGLAATPGNIDAHDVYVSLVYLENPQIAALLPPPTVYFSVSAASAPMIPAAWTSVPAERSGATVFATTWVPANLSWSPVAVAYAPAALGLDPSEDLDALALDLVRGFALFSTDRLLPGPSGPRDPLLVSVLGTGTNTTYRLPNGTPLSTELGLGLAPDDIDGICALDPGSIAQPSQINLPLMMASPQPPLPLGTQNQLHASAWRTFDPISQTEHAVTWMTGWPPGGPQPSLAISAAALSPQGPYLVLDVFVRPNPANPFQGHPEHTELLIPTSVSLTGQPLLLIWGALSPTTFDTSLPLLLLL